MAATDPIDAANDEDETMDNMSGRETGIETYSSRITRTRQPNLLTLERTL